MHFETYWLIAYLTNLLLYICKIVLFTCGDLQVRDCQILFEVFPIFWNTIISLYFYNWKFMKVKRQLLGNEQLSD